WLQKHHKKALNGALDKIKSELMLIGFISLLLPIGAKPISMICISEHLADTMLPCRIKALHSKLKATKSERSHHRKLFWEGVLSAVGTSTKLPLRRILNSDSTRVSHHCANKGLVSLVSQEALHQLHIFIFVLAFFHVLYSVLTMVLGREKMRKWKAWEKTSEEYYSYHDQREPIKFTHETSFGKRHMSYCVEKPILNYIECFFRQFMGSVHRVDYLTLRHGFITRHSLGHTKFDFHRYLQRILDEDFKLVVGISPPLWSFAVVFLVLNVNGWWTFFWLSFVPLLIIIMVGTKLERVITKMALEIQEKHPVVKGTPLVNPDDRLFWFGRPKWILSLIHFSLFQNAFEMAFFIWTWGQFGLSSCFHEAGVIITRVILGTFALFLCSYITLPLYALVSEMGCRMNIRGLFEEELSHALEKWCDKARRLNKLHINSKQESSGSMPLPLPLPLSKLRKCKSEGDLQQLPPKFFFTI
ncbi:hypothetical protein KI387_021358, partial [Taxus chinensis]